MTAWRDGSSEIEIVKATCFIREYSSSKAATEEALKGIQSQFRNKICYGIDKICHSIQSDQSYNICRNIEFVHIYEKLCYES